VAAREIAAWVAELPGLSTENRLLAARASGDAALLLRSAQTARGAAGSVIERQTIQAARALAALWQGQEAAARKELVPASAARAVLQLYARAELEHRRGRAVQRDALLQRLLLDERGRWLVWGKLAALPVGSASADLLRQAFRRARALDAEQAGGILAALALRVGLRAEELSIPLSRALVVLRVEMLPERDLALLEPLVARAIREGLAVGHRLQGELALCRGQLPRAARALRAAVSQDPNDLLGRTLLGRVLDQQGKHDEAARELELAAVRGRSAAQFEYARALDRAGLRGKARAARRALDDEPHLSEGRALAAALELDGEPQGATGVGLATEAGGAALRAELTRFVRAFPPLIDGRVTHIVLAPLPTGLSLSPFGADAERLRLGLQQTLQGAPFYFQEVAVTRQPVERLSPSALRTLAGDTDGVLLYRVVPRGLGGAQIRLVWYERGKSGALEFDDAVDGRALGLVAIRPLVLYLGIGLVGLLALRLGLSRWKGTGEVGVRIALDPATDKHAFTLRITRSARSPTIGDAERYTQRLLAAGARSGRFVATRVRTFCRFEHVPAGRYHVHLYGTQTKGGQLHKLPPGLSQPVEVHKDRTAQVSFNLEPPSYELRVSVYDGDRPVPSARVWLDDDRSQEKFTDLKGQVTLTVPRHERHQVTVHANNATYRRWVEHDDTKAHALSFNLVKERQLTAFAGGVNVAQSAPEARAPAHGLELDAEALEAAPGTTARGEDADQADAGQAEGAVADPPAAPTPAVAPAGPRPAGGTVGRWGGKAGGERSPEPTPPPEAETELEWIASKPSLERLAAAADAPPGPIEPAAPEVGAAPDGRPVGLQRYQRTAELGRGAMGVVYRAWDRVLERDIALKVIGQELRDHPVALKMFVQEAKALAALNHPNVVTVYDQGQDGPLTFLVMEFVAGRTLESAIGEQGALSLPEGLDVAVQLCAGLAFAHGRQILHRDIKPENVFLSDEGVVKIGDFGLARVMRELSIQRTEIRGTPLYMSPEQIRGTDLDFRSDIYALGCTLFSIFTGRPPFVDGEIFYHHLHTEPPRPSEIVSNLPAELDQAIVACLAKDKEGRPESATALREALRPLHARFC
jgi:predicted Zn-dependent protease